RLEGLVALPVAIRLFHHDAALEQQPFEHLVDVELLVLCVAHAEGDVLEIAEQGHVLRGGFGHDDSVGAPMRGRAMLTRAPHVGTSRVSDSRYPRVPCRGTPNTTSRCRSG